MQKLNITKDRAQIVDEENRITCLVSCLLPELWSLKCQKWLIFCWYSKKLVSSSLGKYVSASKRTNCDISENSMSNRPRLTGCETLRVEIQKNY